MAAPCSVLATDRKFDVATGRVVSGPVKHKTKTFQTEARGSEIYVKRPIKENKKKAA